jgi:hypothetical protein
MDDPGVAPEKKNNQRVGAGGDLVPEWEAARAALSCSISSRR